MNGSSCSTILLVENEEAHAELTKRTISKTGNVNRIDVVINGEEALDYPFNRVGRIRTERDMVRNA